MQEKKDIIIYIGLLVQMASAIIDRTPEDLEQCAKKLRIVPDVFPEAPKNLIKVKYQYGFIPNLGNKLITNDIQDIPLIMMWMAERKSYYSLLLIGPDEPSPHNPYNREWVYWLKVNILESHHLTGDTYIQYHTPKPTKGTGWHRYVFVLFKQPHGNLTVDIDRTFDSPTSRIRANFSVVEFGETYNLGKPYAANFFIMEWRKDFETNTPMSYVKLSMKERGDPLAGEVPTGVTV